jgi:RHS repeat-associated protein
MRVDTRPGSSVMVTDYGFTGQRTHSLGMLWYNSRFYDPMLGRWSKPDNIIPYAYDSQSWDHFSYVRNNSIKYIDPTGNMQICDDEICGRGRTTYDEGKNRIRIEGKHCRLVPLGNCNLSSYHNVSMEYNADYREHPHYYESEAINAKCYAGACKNEEVTFTFNRRFLRGREGLAEEGSGIIHEGHEYTGYIISVQPLLPRGYWEYYEGKKDFYIGNLAYSTDSSSLIPYYHAAMAQPFRGNYIYIPELRDYHNDNGIFYVSDTGDKPNDDWKLRGQITVDIFAGAKDDLNINLIDNTPVYIIVCDEDD